ncbi:MAG: CCA tRNA nucleotidyltransferase [Clostridiaceae bacterium]|nr:CCA tRNA nucleotidyltransferase [Clostridiaceae bacterium]
MKISLPKNIADIIAIINDSGFKAHIVGGCVRDIIIGKTPTDWDITTNASPQVIKSLFPKTVDTGIKHGTVTVIQDGIPVEVTTWRKETGYSDHRHPDSIRPADSLEDDLSRRDFTMNAIAYHPEEGLTDPFGGFKDINNKIIRCVGNPYKRFSEDALRMLRAIRFSAQLDFNIDDYTKEAVAKLSPDLVHVSKERIQAELNRILESQSPARISLLWETGLFRAIFPYIENLPPIWSALAIQFVSSPNQRFVLLALLFHFSFDTHKQEKAEELLTSLKYDNETKRNVTAYLKCLESSGPASPRNIRKTVTEFGVSVTADVYKVRGIINPHENINNDIIKTIFEMSPVELSLSGLDLKNAGYTGKEIKDMLSILSLCVFEKPELNDRQTLLEIVGAISRRIGKEK